MKKFFLLLTIYHTLTVVKGQTKRVLFLGNSYTYVNNLPQMIKDVSASTGDLLTYDNNTPGGYYFADHLNDSLSINKIKAGNWDNVVLQDQSLSFAAGPPSSHVLFASKLDSIIKTYNVCGQTLFYITWGRKNGDIYFCEPPECGTSGYINRTYYRMDSTIEKNYMFVADSLKAMASPVGAVWRYIRQHYPSIELFQSDESHPSQAGTYAAACCFYTALFRKDPTLISFNSVLTASDAANIKNAAKLMVYDSLLHWNIGKYDSLLNTACNSSVQNWYGNSVIKNFPNPFTTQTTLWTNTFFHNATLTVNNCFGQTAKQIKNISGQAVTLHRDDLPSGLYFLLLTDDNKIYTNKIIVSDN